MRYNGLLFHFISICSTARSQSVQSHTAAAPSFAVYFEFVDLLVF